PLVRAGAGWRYVALEPNAANAVTARVWFRVRGRAQLDDASLSPTPLSCMANKNLELDQRGRIPFWNDEKDESLLPGRRAGKFSSDPNVKRDGKPSLSLTASGDWFAISSINYGLAPWTERYELSAWA